MPAQIEDSLIAATIAVGLRLAVFRLDDVVRWTDRQIERTDGPAGWIIDLSLSAGKYVEDVIGLLNQVAGDVNTSEVCRLLLALLPGVETMSPPELESLAGKIYQITYEGLRGDWTSALLREVDNLHDSFWLARDGFVGYSIRQSTDHLRQFVCQHRDEQVRAAFDPIQFVC